MNKLVAPILLICLTSSIAKAGWGEALNNAVNQAQKTAGRAPAKAPAQTKPDPKLQAVTDFWNKDEFGDRKPATEKMQKSCGCAPELKPKFAEFVDAMSCTINGARFGADNLASECDRASQFGSDYKAKICQLVKTISIERGKIKEGTMNGDITNVSTLK